MYDAIEALDALKSGMQYKDVAALVDLYDDRAHLHSPEGDFKGKEEIRKSYSTWLGHFTGLRTKVESKIGNGNQAAEEWTMTAISSADIPAAAFGETIPATHESLSVHCANIVTVADGRIIDHHVYYDQKEIMDQLGLSGHRE